MRKTKKSLAVASLLCSGMLCVGVGAVVLNGNDAQKVYAETATNNTWTDSTGKTYTFEGDITTHNATDIRDLGVHDLLQTDAGVTGYNVSNNNKYTEGNCMINDTDADWLKSSSGVAFKFKTDSEWYTPAGTENGSARTAMNGDTWISVYYGDLWIQLSFGNWGLKTLYAKATSMTEAGTEVALTRNSSTYYFNGNTFVDPDGNGKYEMSDWVDVYLTKTACTAVSDGSTATGYWFKMTLGTKINGTYNSIEVYNTYVNQPMYNSARNDFGIANESLHRMTNDAFVCTESAWKNHTNLLTVKSLQDSSKATATVDAETYKDVGDMTSENSALADNYVKGLTEWGSGRYYTANDFIANGTADSVGLEVRAKHPANTALATATSTCASFVNILAGSTYVFADYSPAYKAIRFWAYSIADGWRAVGATTNYYFDYDLTKEYAWRITRTNVDFADSSKAGKGAIVKLYIGEIDSTTGKPADDWAEKPVFIVYDPNSRMGTDVANNGLSIGVGNQDCPAHAMVFSSNKYVGVTTVVNGVQTVNKVVRGDNFTLPTITDDNIIHIGWSKGAQTYAKSDFLATGTTFTNLKESQAQTYYALTMTLDTAEKASLRFRKRGDNPLEISLNWKVEATDSSNLGYYFGNINFGWKFTSDNMTPDNTADDKTIEYYVEENNYANGFESPYQYSITQSNIGEEEYTMKFICQAFVEFEINGVKTKFYTNNAPSLEGDGRSVAYVAEKAMEDAREEAITENGVAYINEITTEDGETRYHYLVQEQYDLIVGVVNSVQAN